MAIELSELSAAYIKVGQPLKWDVFSLQGQLLLHKGYVVSSAAQLDSLLDRGMYANAADVEKEAQGSDATPVFDPFWLWTDLRKNASRILRDFVESPNVEIQGIFERLLQCFALVEMLSEQDTDVAVFEMVQMDKTNYVVAHLIQTVFLVGLIANRLGWEPSRRRILCRAAGSMNVAALELQSVLAAQLAPITDAQREEMRTHGVRGRKLLERHGVTDLDWLQAVEGHHPDALPAGRKPSEMANIIHHADIYLAKISPRAYRPPKTPNVAAKELLTTPGVDQRIAMIIIKEFGIYPPGTYVKLANGETSIVTKRGKQAHTPIVFSLSNGAGMPFAEPMQRDTNAASYAISGIIPKNKVMVMVNRAKLFGYKNL